MAISDMSPEELKDFMRAAKMAKANMENWTYVMHNSSLVERKHLEQTIEQMVSTFTPVIDGLQATLEIEALTKFDPIDLI